MGVVSLYLVFAPLIRSWPWSDRAVSRRRAKVALPRLERLSEEGRPLIHRPGDAHDLAVYRQKVRAWSAAVAQALSDYPGRATEFNTTTTADTMTRMRELHMLLGAFIEELEGEAGPTK